MTVVLNSHAVDRPWLDRLRMHLKAHREIELWEMRETPAGAVIRDAVVAAHARARAVVLLVSVNFLAEEFAPGSLLFGCVADARFRSARAVKRS